MTDSLKQLRAELDAALDPVGKAFSMGKYAKTPKPAPLIAQPAPAPVLTAPPATAGPVYKPLSQLPTSVHLDQSNPALPALYINEPTTLDLFDLRGLTIFADKPLLTRITHSLLAPPAGRTNLFGQGQNNPADTPETVIEDCEADLAAGAQGYFNGLMIFSGSFAIRRTKLRNAPVTFINFQSPAGVFTCEDNDFSSPGVNSFVDLANPSANSHAEAVVVQAGQAFIRRNRFDPKDGVGRTKPLTMTGQLLIQGQFGAVDASVEDNAILGAVGVLMPYALQASAPKYPTRLALLNNSWEAGTVGADAYAAVDGSVALAASGNRDAVTGLGIDDRLLGGTPP